MYVQDVAKILGSNPTEIAKILMALGVSANDANSDELELTDEQIGTVEDVYNEMISANLTDPKVAIQSLKNKEIISQTTESLIEADEITMQGINEDALENALKDYVRVKVLSQKFLSHFLVNGVDPSMLTEDQKRQIRDAREQVRNSMNERAKIETAFLDDVISGKRQIKSIQAQLPQKPVPFALPAAK